MDNVRKFIGERSKLVAAISAVVLTGLGAGCASIAGIGGGSEYACKAPPGVKCDSVSGTYANAMQRNLPSQRQGSLPPGSEEDAVAPKLHAVPGKTALSISAGNGSNASAAVTELRSQPRVLRLWVKSYEDVDSDLMGEQRVYVRVDNGRWLVDHYQRTLREAHRPVKPPAQAAQSTPFPSENTAPRPAPEVSSSLEGPSLAQRLNGAGFGNFPPVHPASNGERPLR